MIGANPSPINWGETTQALEEGTADSTHNALEFHPAFGFTDIIQAEVLIKAVEDAQVIALNKEWHDGLPDDLQSAMDAAGQQTFEANLEALSDRRANSVEELRGAGVEFVELSEDERQQWIDAMGYQRSEWDQFKTELAGDMETFRQFEEAANTKSDFDVSPQTIPE
jgi:TRAP-type C4-dicarboxylate transport system substrate-binding protein